MFHFCKCAVLTNSCLTLCRLSKFSKPQFPIVKQCHPGNFSASFYWGNRYKLPAPACNFTGIMGINCLISHIIFKSFQMMLFSNTTQTCVCFPQFMDQIVKAFDKVELFMLLFAGLNLKTRGLDALNSLTLQLGQSDFPLNLLEIVLREKQQNACPGQNPLVMGQSTGINISTKYPSEVVVH